MSTKPIQSIAVLGAGITGLTAAYRLTRSGHRVRLFEAGGSVGGAVRTERADGWLSEGGPNSLLAGDPAVETLLQELGLDELRVWANPAARNRYIVRRGHPVPAPLSPPGLLRSRLFSVPAKLALLREMLMRPRPRHGDVSLEVFMRTHFGQEIVDYAVNPFVTGIYAGNPQKLSTRHAFPKLWELEQKHGSLLRGQMTERKQASPSRSGIYSFRAGLATLPDALSQRLPAGTVVFDAHIQALLPGRPWNVVWTSAGETHTEPFDAVVAALPAPALAQLRFGTLGERPLAALESIEHPPVSSLFLGYRREQITHPLDGFGLLVPEVERLAVLGVLFSSTLFPERAPAGCVALTVLAGGTRQPEIGRLPVDRLLRTVQPDLQRLLGVRGEPVLMRHTFWPRAIPQYNLGYERHLEAMTAVERAHPGFHLGGQARDGISLPACIGAGERLARAAGR